MKRNRHTGEQLISILKANERGVSITELARQNGVTEQPLYRWKAKYSGMEVSEAKRFYELETEDALLKKLKRPITFPEDRLLESRTRCVLLDMLTHPS